MKQIYSLLAATFLFVVASHGQVVQKYGSVIHYTTTNHRFDEILNNSAPTGFDPASATILIKGFKGVGFATFILDIGENDGNNTGNNPFRFIVFFLDSVSQRTTYRAIDVTDPRGNVITGSLGRTDGHSVFGPNGKIYIPTYGLGKYLVEFDQNTYKAIAYPFPPGLEDPFVVSAGPPVSATNAQTLIYGGTFNASQVWWFEPSAAQPKIQFIQFEIDGRQNYVNQVMGKGDWIYARLTNRGLAGDAFKSLYAVNIKTATKYLIFHSTRSNFSIRGFKDKRRPGENNVFLVVNGKSPGTIYPGPAAISMSAPVPPGVISNCNCPCYRIDPAETFWRFPSAIRSTYFKAPYFFPAELTGFNPENTIFQYNQNYAWNTALYQPFVNPPAILGEFICNPAIDNGKFLNVPWDLKNLFPNSIIPNQTKNYYFRLNGEQADVNGAIEDSTNSWDLWQSNDPLWSAAGKPQTSWNNYTRLTYKFPNTSLQTKDVGYFSVTGNVNDLKDYDVSLTGLSMTSASGAGWNYGAATLVKGVKKEGFAVVRGVPVTPQHPLGYEHEFLSKSVNETNDFVELGQPFDGNRLATHMLGGYPGNIMLYNYGSPVVEGAVCQTSAPGVSDCNPRQVSKTYPLEIMLPNGNSQFGPEACFGARLYSPDFYQVMGNAPVRYKLMYVGTTGRVRQGKFTSIALQDFTYNEATHELASPPNAYRVIDRLNYSYFDEYTPWCITNEATSLACLPQQSGLLGNINSAYNEGKGYNLPANAAACRPGYLRTLISVRSIGGSQKKNQLWLFNPVTEAIDAVSDISDPEINFSAIEGLRTISDFYVGKVSGCTGGQCVNIIFLFKLKMGRIDPASIVKFKDPRISSIAAFHITGNTEDFRGDGKIFKLFISYRDNTSVPQVGYIDIVAKNNRQSLSFGQLYPYSYPDHVEIRDFAYVPKDEPAKTTDLLMVGGKSLFVLKDVVPLYNHFTKAGGATIAANNSTMFAYPNPFKTSVSLDVSSLDAGMYDVKLLDNNGKYVLSEQLPVNKFRQVRELSVPATLSAGIYTLQISGNTISRSYKLIRE